VQRALLAAAASTYAVGLVIRLQDVAAGAWVLITSLGILLLYAGVRHGER